MIEEFMLLANKTVATHIGKVKENEHAKTFVYRIHENRTPTSCRSWLSLSAALLIISRRKARAMRFLHPSISC